MFTFPTTIGRGNRRVPLEILSDPILEYLFNTSGVSAPDTSGNANDGSGNWLHYANPIEGTHAAFFDGNADSLTANAIGLNTANPISMSSWVLSDGSITGGPLFRIGTATDYLALIVVSNNIRLQRYTGGSEVYTINWTGATDLSASQYYHVAMSAVPGTDAVLWVDEVRFDAVNTVSGTYDPSVVLSGLTDNLVIGSGPGGDLEAALDVYRLYNKKFTDRNVESFYALDPN